MEWIWWTTVLRPGEGWVLIRWTKKANGWAIPHEVYDRLVRQELDQVIDQELGDVMMSFAPVGGSDAPERARRG